MIDEEKTAKSKRYVWICLAWISLLVLIALVTCFFLPPPAVDRSNVHPELLRWARKAVTVDATFYLDGGSMGVIFVDSSGSEKAFVELNQMGGHPQNGKLFFGPTDSFLDNFIDELTYPECREFLVQELSKNGDHDRTELLTVFELSDSFPSKIRAIFR